MKKRHILLAAGLAALPFVLLAPGRAEKGKNAPFQGRNFAHRGLHTPDKQVPENSLAAFRAAVEAGYGMELDVQLSRAGQVVVFHDDDLLRVCGREERVDALDLAELRTLSICGTEERIPLFSEVLSTVGGRTPLIVELKSGRRNGELCEKTLAVLREYPGVFCIESFDPKIVYWFKKHAPDIFRGQLANPKEDYGAKVSPLLARLLAGCRFSCLNRPDFIAYKIGPRPANVLRKRRKGILLVAWTSHDAEKDAKENDSVIFEACTPPLRYR